MPKRRENEFIGIEQVLQVGEEKDLHAYEKRKRRNR